MWWSDIKEIKDGMSCLSDRLLEVERNIEFCIRGCSDIKGVIKESLVEAIESDDEHSTINRIHDKLNSLIEYGDRTESALLSEQTMDKFEEYMKNIDKLNLMINEFKGCVSIARAAIAEGKELAKEVEEMKKITGIAQHIYQCMLSFMQAVENSKHEDHFKIDDIHRAVCKKEIKKSKKPTKTARKIGVSSTP